MTVFLRLYLSTFTTDFDGDTVFLRWSLADEGDSAAARHVIPVLVNTEFQHQTVLVAMVIIGLSLVPPSEGERLVGAGPYPFPLHHYIIAAQPEVSCKILDRISQT